MLADTEEVEKIMAALDEIAETTCIRFRARDQEVHYVFIRRGLDGSGCSSNVGYLRIGRQVSFISKGLAV